LAIIIVLTVLGRGLVPSQTTQALVTGHIADAITRTPLKDARVHYVHLATGAARDAFADSSGFYVLPLLSPGTYRIRVENGDSYQPREAAAIEIPVSGLIELDFELRPITDLWEAGLYRSVLLNGFRTSVNFYGPDVDFSRSGSFIPPEKQEARLDSSVSTVISPRAIDQLPFPSRDVYAGIVLQPLVSSGTTTVRGLGFSPVGQRPGTANFLLDGVDNNAYLITGPQTITPIEAIQEYRVSLANYSAEYGGTSGLIANAITRSGLAGFHGISYTYLMNDALDANDVARRYGGLPRAPFKLLQPGLRLGGPIFRDRIFGSGAVEYLRTRGFSPCQAYSVPAPGVRGSAGASATLLAAYQPGQDGHCRPEYVPIPAEICAQCIEVTMRPTESVNRTTALARIDVIPSEGLRLMGRLALSHVTRPDYSFSPYPAFTSGLSQDSTSTAVGLEMFRGIVAQEGRFSYTQDWLGFTRAHAELPELVTFDDTSLPSSQLGAGLQNRGRTINASYALAINSRRHILKMGAGMLGRDLRSNLDASQGTYTYLSFQDFLTNSPFLYAINVSRLMATKGIFALSDSQRKYRYLATNVFVEDSWRAGNHLTMTGGLRYDYFGSPTNIGRAPDTVVQLAPLAELPNRIHQATLAAGTRIYEMNPFTWSVRTGLAYALKTDGRTVFRAGFGTFRDALFDNLWMNTQENQYTPALVGLVGSGVSTSLSPPAMQLAAFSRPSGPTLIADLQKYHLIGFDSPMKPPLLKSGFLAIDQTIGRNWHLEGLVLRSEGSQLLTNDVLNRIQGPDRPSPLLPPIFFRSNSGMCNYRAITILSSYRTERFSFQISYTLSASHDNQSDALAGDFDLIRTQTQRATSEPGEAAFIQALHPEDTYGHSDFDQRHNTVLYAIWDIPNYFPNERFARLLSNWTVGGTAAVRSGLPFTILVPAIPPLENVRANLVCASGYQIDQPLAEGRLKLNADCFEIPPPGTNGNTARNGFYGPGAWNFDFSVSRSFRPGFLPERSRFVLRSDFYNALNHANLGSPETNLSCTAQNSGTSQCPARFGQALYGPTERGSYFPPVKPFTETGRQVMLMIRFEF
jgi:hypothetical protein